MGIVKAFSINKSGSPYSLYNCDTREYMGELMNREAFVYWGSEGSRFTFVFLGPSGVLTTTTVAIGGMLEESGLITSCLDYPYGTARIGGTTYKTFIMRSSQPIYRGDASYWGTVAAGRRVATNSNLVGETHRDWKYIDYVESTNGQWIAVDGSNGGFVDTGLASASGYPYISFYGSW